ncbi:glycosyltransferase family 4 protein [Nitrosomonas nitrosa]|uniref:glycosyltransferase family 4 protein n=1 Tax=Nitrosomonas nitrosa TaxID=52442 RepID=UPI0023F933FC|nr:glycosyltransferase family 4 protein [Nitrosomonas nitrosa]MCO6433211.1 glycosyltransferase family 4 protein [Nitrosomonas nitrosa]
MKILMVTRETQAEKRYGLGRSLMPLILEFRQRGITVDYICQTNLGARSVLWQHRIHRFFTGLAQIVKFETDFSVLLQVLLERINMGRLAVKFVVRHGYTHVHCHDPIIATGFRFFAGFNLRCNAVWGITEHGFGCYTQAISKDGVKLGKFVMRLMQYLEVSTLLSANWVIAPTNIGIKQIADDLKISKLPTNWHCVVHARPVINHYSKEEARKRLGWDDNVAYILGVGRIAPVKQFPLLLEACARLKIKKNFQLVILGEGDYNNLKIVAKQLKFAQEIQFAITDDIGLYLCAADLYVSVSASESFGLANLEALTSGTAAICTAVGGVPEVVGNGAILIDSTLDSLITAIQCLLEDDELRQLIAQKGRARAAEWPNIVQVTDAYEAIYRKATNN